MALAVLIFSEGFGFQVPFENVISTFNFPVTKPTPILRGAQFRPDKQSESASTFNSVQGGLNVEHPSLISIPFPRKFFLLLFFFFIVHSAIFQRQIICSTDQSRSSARQGCVS